MSLAPSAVGAGECIGDDAIYVRIRPDLPSPKASPAALFLDRDGTIVEEVGHLRRAADVRLIEGAAEAIATANALAIPVIVVTNQSGIARGLFDWADFAAVEDRIAAALAARGAHLDAVLACPHHRGGRAPYDTSDHPARKPNPGLLLRAAASLALDLGNSWIIGDRAGDILAGRNAGLAGGVHVTTGWGNQPGEREAALAAAVVGGYRVLAAAGIAAVPALLPLFRGAKAE